MEREPSPSAERWHVVKRGKYSGLSVQSTHSTREEADYAAYRCSGWSDATFYVEPVRLPTPEQEHQGSVCMESGNG